MENQNEQKIKFKKFDGRDFTFWKAKVTNGLRYLGLENYLEAKAEIRKTADQVPLEKKALSFVVSDNSDKFY